jgi:hypothetical protein
MKPSRMWRDLAGFCGCATAASCALALAVFAPAASAGPLEHVSNSNDTGAGSLRQAMTAVDPGGEIVFDSPTDDPGLLDQIMIDKDMTITGLGAGTTTISGASNHRVFELAAGVSVMIRDLEITGGNAPDGVDGPTPGADGTAGESGGAILNTHTNSSLTLRRTRIDGNSAGRGGAGTNGDGSSGGGSGAIGGSGGAISSAGTLVVEDSEISNDQAGSGGPGGDQGAIPVIGSGAAGGSGGGIAATGPVSISDSTFSGNTAGSGGHGGAGSTAGSGGAGGDGGALRFGGGGALALVNVTMTLNEAGSGGAIASGGAPGVSAGAGGSGGGLFTTAAATVTNATIAANTAGTGQPGTLDPFPPFTSPPVNGKGGGVAGAATLNNTIVSSNNAPDTDLNCDNAVLDGDFNISFPDVAQQGCPAGFSKGDPMLGPLAANGGATRTMAITTASSAFDHVPTSGAGCPATDQRGVLRPQFTQCDAGAFELAPAAPPPAGGGTPTATAPTGQRAAALKKCKKKKTKQKRKNCKKKARKLPV